jgi:transcriptional regulator with XRE-family HTH domain
MQNIPGNTDKTQFSAANAGLQVGRLLKELRRKRGLTGIDLGKKAGISQSKLSKLETGAYTSPKVQDVDKLLNILQAPNNIRQQIYREIERAHPQALLYKPYRTKISINLYDQAKLSTLIRVFTLPGVPAHLQTTAFRMAILRKNGIAEEELEEYLKDTMKRQDLLWDRERSFHFIMHEVMLYSPPDGHWELMAPQIDRIERMMELPNVKVGIVPTTAGLPMAQTGPFAVHDQRRAVLELGSGELESTDRESIAFYTRVFLELDRLALYGEPAKQLMHSVKW